MANDNKIKRITTISILIALACIFSYIDKLLSSNLFILIPVIGPFLSGFKMGMANIIVLYIIFRYGFKEGLITILLKSIIIGFIYSGLFNFIIGFVGSLFSFLVMYLLKMILNKKLVIFISMVGGFTHMLFQILTVVFIYKLFDYVLLYSPFLLMFGLVTGLFVGLITNKILSLIINEE